MKIMVRNALHNNMVGRKYVVYTCVNFTMKSGKSFKFWLKTPTAFNSYKDARRYVRWWRANTPVPYKHFKIKPYNRKREKGIVIWG